MQTGLDTRRVEQVDHQRPVGARPDDLGGQRPDDAPSSGDTTPHAVQTLGTTDMARRLMGATTAALELFAVHLGSTLGLYDALDRHGPMTPHDLAELTDINERYAREWLEQQAVAGFVSLADGRFALPAEYRGALLDPVDGDYVAPFATMLVGIAAVLDDVAQAYRTGGGVEYAKYGAHFRKGQGAINRPAFSADLVQSWLPAIDGVTERLAAGGRLVDIGTGLGWSAIAVKSAWPAAEVIGLDIDAPSIADARRNAELSAVDVRFEVADPSRRDLGVGPVDVVLILEALHDMARPVGVLAAARASLRPGGTVVVADEAVAATFTAPGDDLERMMYGWSVTHCLPAAMAEHPSAALGTALRPDAVAELATSAGFGRCDVIDVDAGFFRIYRLSD